MTFSTDGRRRIFADDPPVTLVCTQILRAAGELRFEIDAYCFMPDHLHLIAAGSDEASDAKAFIKRAKRYSGYYFKKEYGEALWQRCCPVASAFRRKSRVFGNRQQLFDLNGSSA